jgi:small-conductance mechanosensitive channel
MRAPARPPTTGAIALLSLLWFFAAFGAPGAARGQEPTPPTVTPEAALPEPPRPSLAELIGAGGATEVKLLQIEADLAPDAVLQDLEVRVPDHLARLEERAGQARERIAETTQLRQLVDIESRWATEQSTLEDWRTQTTGRALAINEGLAQVDGLIAVWERTGQEARDVGAPATVTERIGRTLDAAQTTREKIVAHRAEVLALQAEIAGGLGTVADMLERTRRAQQAIRGGLLGTDSLPVWTAVSRRGDLGDAVESAMKSIEHDLIGVREFAAEQGSRFILHGALLILAVGLMLSARPMAARWAKEDESAEVSARVLARPYAAGTLIATFAWPFLYPKAPSQFDALFLLAALVASLRLIPPLLAPGIRPAFYVLAGFFLVDRIRDAMVGLPLLSRLLFEVELAAAIGVVAWLLRAQRLELLPNAARRMPAYIFVRRLALLLLVVALAGSVLGYVALSRLIGEGVLRSAYTGVVLYGGYKVLSGMSGVLVRARLLQYLNLIRDHRTLVAQRLNSLLRLVAIAAWLYYSLGFFSLRVPLAGALVSTLSAAFVIGELEISLGSFIAFAVTLAIAVYLSRFVRYVLDEDVLTRIELPRGVPYAISTTTFYVVLLFGLFAALAAGGFDLSRFTLLAGALGVGIGFGLQNVVNNFVSGLILLFERPINTGDTIQVGELIGEVRRIGIRSSTVRTWEGAEVIVPNANLISDQVVNWTLSDRLRRIDVDVGVTYGTEAERVIELLLDVARADDRILKQPEPTALFLAFGQSSLDFRLRAWTARFDEWMAIRSELTVAIQRALREASIEVPFPQRDLHLRSVDEKTAARLGLAPGESR